MQGVDNCLSFTDVRLDWGENPAELARYAELCSAFIQETKGKQTDDAT